MEKQNHSTAIDEIFVAIVHRSSDENAFENEPVLPVVYIHAFTKLHVAPLFAAISIVFVSNYYYYY